MSRIWIISLLSAVFPLGSTIGAEEKNVTPINRVEVTVQNNMREDPEAAFQTLQNAQTLESAYIGFAGIMSENLIALREVLKKDKADLLLQELYQTGTLTAKLYAIIGFQLLQENDLAQSYINDASQYQLEEIDAMEGCVIYRASVGDALKMIAEGYYVEQFRSAE